MKKRLLFVLLAMTLVLTATGCKKGDDKKEKANTEDVKEEVPDTVEEVKEQEPEEETKEMVIDRTKAFELLSNINVGWNLGNTMDSRGAGNTVKAETYWGNIKTNPEIIDRVAKGGFNAIRIPVTWAEHVGPAPSYRIDDEWMKRVKEIVDYAVDKDMYIILNTHHEENDWLKVDPENQDALVEELSAIWKQISLEFKDYTDKLIFEGMNEPRCIGSEKEWAGGTPEERKVINALNQAFVDAVRCTGGRNEERLLIICTYGNSAANRALAELDIPKDNNIAVAIHMYTPYEFTYIPDNGTGYDTWDGSEKASIVNTVKQLDSYFIKKDVPVVITEFGAQNKGNSQEIIKWIKDYIGTMNRYGIKCFWWDNGLYPGDGKNGNENFAIFHRETLEWYEPEIKDALVNQDYE